VGQIVRMTEHLDESSRAKDAVSDCLTELVGRMKREIVVVLSDFSPIRIARIGPPAARYHHTKSCSCR
jgi:hypothetical protein